MEITGDMYLDDSIYEMVHNLRIRDVHKQLLQIAKNEYFPLHRENKYDIRYNHIMWHVHNGEFNIRLSFDGTYRDSFNFDPPRYVYLSKSPHLEAYFKNLIKTKKYLAKRIKRGTRI